MVLRRVSRAPDAPGRLYAVVRVLAVAILRFWFRVRIEGAENIRTAGPVILAPNHKNFLDPFFVGIATRRPVRFMAKVELFKGPMGWLFSRLGAFPVRRGAADSGAMSTSRAILESGGVLVVFPEGTRVEQPDALGSPHHGAGRLALDTGAPIVPVAITGTSHLWRGALPRIRRVQIAFLAAVAPPELLTDGHDPVAELIDELVWPAVQDEYGRLYTRPGVLAAALAAAGIGGGLLARRRLGPGSRPRVLGFVAPRRKRSRTRAAREWLSRRFPPSRRS